MPTLEHKRAQRIRRHKKVRTRVVGSSERPRLGVFKSNRAIHAGLYDDERGVTLVSLVSANTGGGTKTNRAREAGKVFAADAKKKHIAAKVVFDRGGFLFTGRVKAFAEGAREGGLIF